MASSLHHVEAQSAGQWALGDAALEIEPIRAHGGHGPVPEDGVRVEESLRVFAEDVGLSLSTVKTYRWVASKWPAEQRAAGVAWEVHKILLSAADPYGLIADPPVNERTGRCGWDGEAAKRAVGWKTSSSPVTVAEKVETVAELVADEAVACQVITSMLARREVAFVAMCDSGARKMVNEIQFEQTRTGDDDAGEDWEDEAEHVFTALDGPERDEEGDVLTDPATVVRAWHRASEFTDLMGVCHGFVAGASRLVPRLRGQEFTERQHTSVEKALEKIRATCDWIETAVATGQTDLDEALAQLLRGQRCRAGFRRTCTPRRSAMR
ncbi:DUF6192 family protein [Streptomyces viridiviolaceus]